MKRFIVFTLALTLVFSLCSCGSSSSNIGSLQKENKFFSRVMNLFKEDAKKRYYELRSSCLNVQFMSSVMNENMKEIGECLRQKDLDKFNTLAKDVVTPKTILRAMTKRLQVVDEQIKNW